MPTETPIWAEELRRRYLRGEATQFILHGNVYDRVVSSGKLVSVCSYLAEMLAESKETVFIYNVSVGGKLLKNFRSSAEDAATLLSRDAEKVLPVVERMLRTKDKLAVILEYAEMIVPAADTNFLSDGDRGNVVALHRWSLAPEIASLDNIIVLIVENLSELHPKLVSNPKIATIKVEAPNLAERQKVIKLCDPTADDVWASRLASVTAGLKAIQIESILRPKEAKNDAADRETFIRTLLGPEGNEEWARKLTHITGGMDRDEIRKLVAPHAPPQQIEQSQQSERDEVDRLISASKRKILERECFGLIEFVEPKHDFSAVGGIEPIKEELRRIASAIREGRTSRVPMGLLFTGPMGTGKTFVAEAFAAESGLTTIKLKNFRSKWVGSTEGNLEKIFGVIQAIGQVVVIVDEVDRAFGTDGDGDGGTSSRVIARLKEFMSDSHNRGRILFVLMTNRPDKLDLDIKRAGRCDRKIPFFYPQTPEQVVEVCAALIRRHKIATTLEFPRDQGAVAPLVGLSNPDIEEVLRLAERLAEESGTTMGLETLQQAIMDYMPARDTKMLEFMELLAVFETSNRRMLPPKYADMSVETLQARLAVLKHEVGSRR